ncbi:MG2 domain-containing protein [Pricia sp. S334]|uniref:MG2 domain-containing protein n=1 Tax=Pricia mediterranea TaxID=3076079 RepID=A0ABU3L7G4_9FLAO|nr:MG2 domain-containing protein [Pricia sp. S334]MDT7829620.1 MG2 domain-containing protein [Pricia sp. S334]
MLTLLTGNAQNQDDFYSALWKKVEQFEKDDLTKSALNQVRIISEKAKSDNNAAQIIKTLLYTSKYVLTLEEDAQLKIIEDFRSEIRKADFPAKNVLESYLAHLYWQYFQQNRHRFYNRTETATKVDTTDFRTWDLTTLFHEIDRHFKASLENKEGLQKTGLKDFKDILIDRPESDTYRPTLFDLLAHSALQFYKTDETGITRPADQFEIADSELLCGAYAFTQKKIPTKDQTSLQAKALLLYQELLQFHFPHPRLDALVEVDIERLNYIHENAVLENKDQIYLDVLQNSAENLKQHEVSALYSYEMARLYHRQGNSYTPKKDDDRRWKLKEALALCDAVIARFPDSRGAEKCRALKFQILAPDVQLTTERHIPNRTDALLLVRYKNIGKLQLRAFEISQEELDLLNETYPQTKQLAFLQKLKVAKTWDTSLKDEGDYQQHGIEVLLPGLENGQYIIMAIPAKNDGKENNNDGEVSDSHSPETKTFSFSPVQVTDLALITLETSDSYSFQVIHRTDGHPISGAEVQLTYRKNHNKPDLYKTMFTDKDGTIRIPLSEERWSDIRIQVAQGDDTARFGPYYVGARRDSNPANSENSCFLFTDRSIYRPGQPLYFKGIAIQKKQNKSSILKDAEVQVDLRDVNGQSVKTQRFESNDYGSFSGEFILPDTGLTGNYTLQASSTEIALSGYAHFSVEEYKRPKFETSFSPVTKTFRVNDRISVVGNAAAYAGSQVTDAKVSYRVKRVVRFPGWYYWRRPYFNQPPQEIARGETVTDASGNYEIDFKAIPDHSIPKENQPIFRYEVTADVTDINGETHTATTTVAVGYHALTASIDIPDRLNKDSETDTLGIATQNLNGLAVDARGTLKMYKLQAPDRVLRQRPWAAPDYRNWEKTEFKRHFPHEAFADEHDPTNWERGKLVWESDFDTGKSTEIPLEIPKKWDPGKYVVELETTDRFGQEVRALAQTTLYGGADKKVADNQLFRISTDKKSYAVGEDVEVTLASASENLSVSIFVEKDKKIVDTWIIQLKDNATSLTVPVVADDLGGFAINYSLSAYNAFESGSLSISVPYPNSDLEIETLTFRDKLSPGTDETWSFKIKGPKGEKVSAELLAGMYDASLDAFREHSWSFDPLMRSAYNSNLYVNARESYGITSFRTYLNRDSYNFTPQRYDTFEWFGLYFGNGYHFTNALHRTQKNSMPEAASDVEFEEIGATEAALNENVITEEAENKETGSDPSGDISPDQVPIRKNLQETAFFFPQLRTDGNGNVSFDFTTPEALTRWKLQLLAHTESLKSTMTRMETVTQKELMVIPNAPRFLREGDEVSISTKISNLTEQMLSGQAQLVLTDALTHEDITEKLLIASFDVARSGQAGHNYKKDRTATGNGAAGKNPKAKKEIQDISFKVDSMGNTQVSWRLKIPKNVQAVQYKVVAKAGNFSDGEQNLLPVLTNRKLVTETLPMWVRSDQTKTFQLDKLKNTKSPTLKNHKLTLEITSNPAWYAVQALPYLMEYPYDCSEQIFARYYANSLAEHIANSNPRIREVFEQWAGSDALLSNLEKNEELKSLLIQETPWVRAAQSESEQKKRIALLFDMNRMKNERTNELDKLKSNQKPSGAWAWFSGGPDNRVVTQYIVAGMGHLKRLNAISSPSIALRTGSDERSGPSIALGKGASEMLQNAIAYLDSEFVKEYERMKKHSQNIEDDHLSPTQIHYLYMRSFFPNIKTSKKVDEITAYYKGQAQKYWTNKDLYPKGMLALALSRMNDGDTANKILRGLRENSITSEELGMYWKENTPSWHWYQAPIEAQALIIEAFGEIQNDTKTIDELKVWLLKHKQTNQWRTTKATAEATYALLLHGSDWLSITDAVEVLVGGDNIDASHAAGLQGEKVPIEAGTGYYKTIWNANEIEPELAEVQLHKKGKGIAWGALYWQYFEELDKITSAETPLHLKKKLFLKKNTETGEAISEITPTTKVEVGDLVRVRIELRADRAMEFLHMKDMRAAGFVPVNVLSRYKWQDGLGYYESTKDASTDFFFDYLPKGVYVFEYDLRVNNAGEFSNGITTIQSMYAPEFSSHSEGVRVAVDGR